MLNSCPQLPTVAAAVGRAIRGDTQYCPTARGQTASPLNALPPRLANPERILVAVLRVSRIVEFCEKA
jgi:hypothetical protein